MTNFDASADIARRFRVSELAIGLTLVSIGTSLPELASSLYAAFCNQPEFIVGNIVGSITTNITLMLGLGALIGGSLCFSRRLLTRDAVFMFLVFLLTVLLLRFANDLEEYGKVEQMPALEGKKMFLYLSPKKAGVAKKSQQKMDRERREAEAKAQSELIKATETEISASGGLFANAKNGADALKKLNERKEKE